MKRILAILLAGVLIVAAIFQRNNNPDTAVFALGKQAGPETKELRYRVYLFGLLPIGRVVFEREKEEIYSGAKVYYLRATAGTSDFISKIFRARAALDSYVDAQNFNPVFFRQKLSLPGKPDALKEAYYDQKKGVMSISGVQRQILPNTQDPLSVIFNIRRMDFSYSRGLELNLNTNQKNYIMKGAAQPGEIVSHKKIYRTAVLTADIRRRDKNPYHKSSISALLLREYGNTPVLIKVFAGGFLIIAKLIEAK